MLVTIKYIPFVKMCMRIMGKKSTPPYILWAFTDVNHVQIGEKRVTQLLTMLDRMGKIAREKYCQFAIFILLAKISHISKI